MNEHSPLTPQIQGIQNISEHVHIHTPRNTDFIYQKYLEEKSKEKLSVKLQMKKKSSIMKNEIVKN